jgi:hypothetical protein
LNRLVWVSWAVLAWLAAFMRSLLIVNMVLLRPWACGTTRRAQAIGGDLGEQAWAWVVVRVLGMRKCVCNCGSRPGFAVVCWWFGTAGVRRRADAVDGSCARLWDAFGFGFLLWLGAPID